MLGDYGVLQQEVPAFVQIAMRHCVTAAAVTRVLVRDRGTLGWIISC
jgi:hypothetical protein